MKVFIDARNLNPKYLSKIKERFPKFEIVSDVEKSYDSEVIIVEPSYVKEENINKYYNLKWIQSFRAGYDTVDFASIRKRNIVFTNARDVYSIAIAEDVINKILVLNRNVKEHYKNMESKIWKPNFRAFELYNCTVGIVGMGSIAKEIAKRIKAFDVKVIGYRKNYQEENYFDEVLTGEDGLNTLLKNSDYVILTVPLNSETKGLIDREKLSLMRSTALLVNIARGEVVVQEDLIEALENKTIRGAALDVTVPEPLPANSKLWDLDNVFITPHCSAASPYITSRLVDLIIKNLDRYNKDLELLNIV